MGWTIKGESGVTVQNIGGVTYGLDGTERTFDDLGISGWSLKFQNLADDAFTYTVRTKNAKGLGTIVPRDGQEIHVYYDGVRKFKGHVVKPKFGLKTMTITALGPWWWMGKITLSGEAVDSTGGSDDRTSYAFPTQGLRTSFRSLINRAADMGVPMKKVTDADESSRISGMFSFVKTTLSNMSFAAAFTELMSYVPDAVAWIDYEATPPALNITRRGAMTAITYAVGSTGSVRVESADIYPRTDQEVKRVELKFMQREAVTGRPKWASQNYGSASADADKRKIQIVTVSGPETLDFVPKDDFDSVALQTVDWSAATADFVIANDSALSAIKSEYGVVPGTIANTLSYYQGQDTKRVRVSLAYPGRKIRAVNGAKLKKAQKWLLISGATLPDWAVKKFKAVEVELTGTWIAWTANGIFTKSFQALRVGATAIDAKFRYESTSSTEKLWFTVRPWTVRGWVINVSRPSKTTEYKPWDYDFMEPPSGLAENLRNAQNWVPWEGPVVIARPDLNGYNGLQRKFNLSNAHPDMDGMDAIVKSVTYDGSRHRVTWDLGPPPRADLGGLVNKMRRNPQDNIVWL